MQTTEWDHADPLRASHLVSEILQTTEQEKFSISILGGESLDLANASVEGPSGVLADFAHDFGFAPTGVHATGGSWGFNPNLPSAHVLGMHQLRVTNLTAVPEPSSLFQIGIVG